MIDGQASNADNSERTSSTARCVVSRVSLASSSVIPDGCDELRGNIVKVSARKKQIFSILQNSSAFFVCNFY
jgi:hypothetical protein